MPDDFIEDLDGEILNFEGASRDRDGGTDAHVAARAALDTAMEKAMNALRRLDAAVPNRLRTDPPRLAVSTRVRRIAAQRQPRRSEASGETPVAPPPAAGGRRYVGRCFVDVGRKLWAGFPRVRRGSGRRRDRQMDERIAEDSTRCEADQGASVEETHLSDVSELLAAGITSGVTTTRVIDLNDPDFEARLCQVSIS